MAMFEQKWQLNHLKKVKQKAGARYTPELNVSLPISEIFEGISRTKTFYTNIRKKYGELLREFKYVTSKFESKDLQKEYDKIRKNFDNLCKVIEEIKTYNNYPKCHKKIRASKAIKFKHSTYLFNFRIYNRTNN